MNGRNDIIRPGQVKRQVKGALTSASEVMDYRLHKSQEEINKGIEALDKIQTEDLVELVSFKDKAEAALKSTASKIMNGATVSDVDDIPQQMNNYTGVATEIPTHGADPNIKYNLGYVGGGGGTGSVRGEGSPLDITLYGVDDPTNALAEYFFDFMTYGSYEAIDAPNITFPSYVQWVEEPTFENGKHYQVSIVNKIGIVVCVDIDNPEDEPTYTLQPDPGFDPGF